jgi:uncharacterized protein
MQTALLLATLWMGLFGGPHCVMMCGAACAGIAQAGGARSTWSLVQFHAGRTLGYALLGGLAAASMQGLGWLTVYSAALRPVWSLLHVAAMVLGLVLIVHGRQPVWLEQGARALWLRVRHWGLKQGKGQPMVLGACWALLPCGLLYSALLVAALASNPVQGALAMASFAVGTTVGMVVGPWLWLRLLRGQGLQGQWGVRLAGWVLFASAAGALWMGWVHQTAPWCVTTT